MKNETTTVATKHWHGGTRFVVVFYFDAYDKPNGFKMADLAECEPVDIVHEDMGSMDKPGILIADNLIPFMELAGFKLVSATPLARYDVIARY